MPVRGCKEECVSPLTHAEHIPVTGYHYCLKINVFKMGSTDEVPPKKKCH